MASGTLLLCVSAVAAPDPAPDIHGETIQQTAERTGYTVEEIRRFFPPIRQWGRYGIEPPPGKLADTFARERFGPPRASG
jgi:hypothetical protein